MLLLRGLSDLLPGSIPVAIERVTDGWNLHRATFVLQPGSRIRVLLAAPAYTNKANTQAIFRRGTVVITRCSNNRRRSQGSSIGRNFGEFTTRNIGKQFYSCS
ncbi:hypothetical protein [Bythopirellula goksoeyrii]|uniref:hypothetical protein n=1 Tax=Bythopirellula goksoeyrii TaxID=1400387 RepID=UPI0011CD998F|nr:hypothetical protein [Bythopirellula goksoeyrii]